MSVDYRFYPRDFVLKNRKFDIKETYFIEGYIINNINIIIDLFKLPKLPFYYCEYVYPYYSNNYKYIFKQQDLPTYYDNLILNPRKSKTNIENYENYKDWIDWGIFKFNNLTVKDIEKVSNKIEPAIKDIFDDLKEYLPLILDLYNKHYYVDIEV